MILMEASMTMTYKDKTAATIDYSMPTRDRHQLLQSLPLAVEPYVRP